MDTFWMVFWSVWLLVLLGLIIAFGIGWQNCRGLPGRDDEQR